MIRRDQGDGKTYSRRGLAAWLALVLAVLFVVPSPSRAGTVQLLDGTSLEGDLAIDNGLIVRGAKVTRVPLNAVLRASFKDAVQEEFQPGLVLVNGAHLAGTFTSLAETTVKLSSGLVIPGSEVAWAVYQPFTAALAAQVPPGKTGALLPGGDFFEGSTKGADANTAKVLNAIFGPRVFDGRKKEIEALILREVRPQGAAYEVVTADGSVYAAFDLVLRDPASLTIRHPLYDGLKVDLKEVIEIRVAAARFYALDRLKPSRVDAPSGQTPEQAFAVGHGLDGAPLKIGGKVTASGFESSANTVLTWDMPAGATAFIARVMPGATTPAGQKATFTLYADGKALARTPPLGTSDPPAVLRAPLPANAKLLSLRTEATLGSGVWGEPILLRR